MPRKPNIVKAIEERIQAKREQIRIYAGNISGWEDAKKEYEEEIRETEIKIAAIQLGIEEDEKLLEQAKPKRERKSPRKTEKPLDTEATSAIVQ